jgi:hypothetical protein
MEITRSFIACIALSPHLLACANNNKHARRHHTSFIPHHARRHANDQRAFMETACNRILELDGTGGAHLHRFGGTGSYTKFKEVSERPT